MLSAVIGGASSTCASSLTMYAPEPLAEGVQDTEADRARAPASIETRSRSCVVDSGAKVARSRSRAAGVLFLGHPPERRAEFAGRHTTLALEPGRSSRRCSACDRLGSIGAPERGGERCSVVPAVATTGSSSAGASRWACVDELTAAREVEQLAGSGGGGSTITSHARRHVAHLELEALAARVREAGHHHVERRALAAIGRHPPTR